jgi:hypothetical protein
LSSLFLSEDEVADLTGIKRGRCGKSRDELQCQLLRERGVPFIKNIAGAPKVARAVIDGSNRPAPQKQGWSPAVLNR